MKGYNLMQAIARVNRVCSYDFQITYADKRKEIIRGDVAGGTFDSILEKFIHSIFPELFVAKIKRTLLQNWVT